MSDTYGFPADVYSFSILLWQIVTSRTPYADILSPAELASKVVTENKRPSLAQIDFSDSLKSLMESGWSADPTKRPTFSVIGEELEKLLTQHDQGSNGETRRGYFRRTASDSTGLREISPGPTNSTNIFAKRRNLNSEDGGSTWNDSKPSSLMPDPASRRMSM